MKSLSKHKKLISGGYEVESPILRAFNYVLLIIITFIVLCPIYVVFTASFKSNGEYMKSGAFSLPKSFFYFDNYKTVLKQGQLALAYANTLILIIVSVILSVMMAAMVAYALGRFKFKGRKFLIVLFFIPTLIPSTLTQVATFTLISKLHVFNTLWSCILIYIGTDIVQIYLFLQFVEKIPYSLDESALIEGASYFRVFRSIIIPQLKPAMATVIILKVLGIYNDMLNQNLYMPKSSLVTVSTALLSFSNDRNSQWNVMSAGVIAIMIPTIILYLFMQKFIFAGITEGAVKD
ncbi:carbohydrate ABC transporter permease [Clostridium felsineum]|uniref:carbohydrate ABC transporter permease n=1 Tax=Clostridium felsineum TaxID=36839 RepID=UPI00098C92BD|nr:carbohydrate ABC transporter permease [Clostridium felsineum]URZ18271.1 L-arabinose transport system permease protein AraQ [Clostridium felsineum DSM 794]